MVAILLCIFSEIGEEYRGLPYFCVFSLRQVRNIDGCHTFVYFL